MPQETDERILLRYAELLQEPPTPHGPTATTVVTYSYPDGEVYIAEQPSLIAANGTTGLRTWEASLLLSEWVLSHDMNAKRVLELGAGTGLVGILAAKRGADVTATDGSALVMETLERNFRMNDVSAKMGCLWWGEDEWFDERSSGLEDDWDYVLGADVTYDEEVCSSLAETYSIALRRGGIGMMAATVRNENTLDAFIKDCGNIY